MKIGVTIPEPTTIARSVKINVQMIQIALALNVVVILIIVAGGNVVDVLKIANEPKKDHIMKLVWRLEVPNYPCKQYNLL